jgi:hypothetical protein
MKKRSVTDDRDERLRACGQPSPKLVDPLGQGFLGLNRDTALVRISCPTPPRLVQMIEGKIRKFPSKQGRQPRLQRLAK